ncbi:unnamed protein product [Effrenium voratum]|nr:unnamed protein product [Effrenium voratum]
MDSDWIAFREDLRLFVQTAVPDLSSEEGLTRILLGRDRLVMEAKAGACWMQHSGACWARDFRTLLSQHLVEGRPFCLLGCTALQLMMMLFVREPLQGTWNWEEAFRCSNRRQAQACLVSDPWSTLDTLAAALRVLLPVVRWMDWLDSGWPFFQLVSRIVAQNCKGTTRCVRSCSEKSLKVLAMDLESHLLQTDAAGLSKSALRNVALACWTSTDFEVQASLARCGDLALAEAAAMRAATFLEARHLQDSLVYLQITQLFLAELFQRDACAFKHLAHHPDLWLTLSWLEKRLQSMMPYKLKEVCQLHFCPEGSPNLERCRCEVLDLGPHRGEPVEPEGVCMVTADPGDDRPLERQLGRLVALDAHQLSEFWSLTFHLNRIYALRHGYRFTRLEVSNDEVSELLETGAKEPRRIQWLIVRLVQRVLQDPSCKYVVWLDSDAYIASSQPLQALIQGQGLANRSARPSFFFAAASASKILGRRKSLKMNISDHFMVVRNSPSARRLMERWWQWPDARAAAARWRRELFLEQTVMNDLFPRHPKLVAKVPPLSLAEGFAGRFVRHVGGIKDAIFRLALRDALVARLLAVHSDAAGWGQLQADHSVRRARGRRAPSYGDSTGRAQKS